MNKLFKPLIRKAMEVYVDDMIKRARWMTHIAKTYSRHLTYFEPLG